MEKDEDMFIVIVGDKNTDNSPAQIQNKQVTLDKHKVEQVIDCLNNAEDVQHIPELDVTFVKEEISGTEDSNEYLSEISSSFDFNENINFNYEDEDDDDDKYFPDFIEASVNGLSVTMSNDISLEENEKKNAHRTKFIKPSQSTTNLYKHEKRCDAPDAEVVLRARALALGRKGRSRPYIPTLTDDNSKRTKLLKPSQRYSYVEELRNKFPNLKDDPDLLATTLAEIMKNTKPPPLPQDYYIMNGIMLECINCGHHSQSIMEAGRHYQEKHGERYLFCYSCGVNFRSAGNLYKHEKRCHAPDAEVVLRARALALGRKERSRPYIPTHTDEPKRTKLLKPSQRYSYVEELRNKFPNLKDDPDLLATTLAGIMKNTRPPPPPEDYYIINGIMLECINCGHHSQSIMEAGRHYQEKHGERYLSCYSCGVNFRSTTNLYKHEKRCDAPDAELVLRARALALGRKGRSRPYIPTLTDDKPKSAANMYKHEKRCDAPDAEVGRSRPRFECSECSALFRSKIGLRAHLYTHRGERPHRCRLCAAAYTSPTSLARHMKKHSDVEYICDHCKRSFKVKAILVAHMYTHRSVKRFGCAECPKRYSQKAALDLHVMQKHRKMPPPCACRLCPKRFRRMSILKEHMTKIHGMMIVTRKMFFKKLPTLSTTQIDQAQLVFKDEVDNQNSYFITQSVANHKS